MTSRNQQNDISPLFLERLIQHEGLKLKPYRCTAGKLTIGVGRNLEDKGLTKSEALFLLTNDVLEAKSLCQQAFSFFDELTPVRQEVLIEMAFNLGINGLKKFQKCLTALEKKEYQKAGQEMLNSSWAKQVKTRAKTLAHLMQKGEV